MSLYYDGDIERDMVRIKDAGEERTATTLDGIGRQIGYGRAQQILQILWARRLKEQGLPIEGALYR